MDVVRHDSADPEGDPPHRHNGRVDFRAENERENNILAGFIEDQLGEFVTSDVSLAPVFTDRKVCVWVSARSADKVQGTISELVRTLEKAIGAKRRTR